MPIIKRIIILVLSFCCLCYGYVYFNDLKVYIVTLYNEKHSRVEEKKEHIIDPLPKFDTIFESTSDNYLPANPNYGKIQDIISRGELVVCAKQDDNNTLFQVKIKENEYQGKDIEFAKLLAANLGVKLRYRMIYKTYDDVVQAIERGEGDIGIAKISYTAERAKKVFFTTPYVILKQVILINRVSFEKYRDESIFKSLNNKRTKLGVVSNTAYENVVKTLFPKARVMTDKDWENVIIKGVERNEITATIRDEIRTKALMKKNPKIFINVMPIALKEEIDSIATIVNLNNAGFLTYINRFIIEKSPTEKVDALMAKYGETIK